jgi:hypothetical protein
MPVNLPTEVLEKIIDESRGDLQVLLDCSIANRAFLARSRVNIFHRITFSPPQRPFAVTRCDRFAELPVSNPDVAYYVNTLQVDDLPPFGVSQSTFQFYAGCIISKPLQSDNMTTSGFQIGVKLIVNPYPSSAYTFYFPPSPHYR